MQDYFNDTKTNRRRLTNDAVRSKINENEHKLITSTMNAKLNMKCKHDIYTTYNGTLCYINLEVF